MKFFILGGTGFVGIPLIRHLVRSGHETAALVRSPGKAETLPPGALAVVGDPLAPGAWQDGAGQADVIVNLVGKPIVTRWTTAAKQEILDSRILSTRRAVEAIPVHRAGEMTLVNASAVGFYGKAGDAVLGEDAPPGEGFLADVARRWEDEAHKAAEKGARTVCARLGAVLGREGGVLAQMLPPFRMGLGGRLGSGKQWFSWIHLHDLCRALLFVAEMPALAGPVNMCAPNPATNAELTRTLAAVLNRPAILPVPAAILKLAIGGAAEIALEGQRVVPRVLDQHGFVFDFSRLNEALRDLVGG